MDGRQGKGGVSVQSSGRGVLGMGHFVLGGKNWKFDLRFRIAVV